MRDRFREAVQAPNRRDRPMEPARRQLDQTRLRLERGWQGAIQALEADGHRELAVAARRFVDRLPPARTEAEWLMAQLTEKHRRQDRAADHMPSAYSR